VAGSAALVGRPQSSTRHATTRIGDERANRRLHSMGWELGSPVAIISIRFLLVVDVPTNCNHVIMPKTGANRILAGGEALPTEGPRSVQMADGNRERVGSIHGFGRFGKLKQPRDHVLDLLLFGAAIADN
jgi:hypothetical protein